MKTAPSPPEHHEPDEELIKLLKDLGAFRVDYPAALLHARRAAFLAKLEELSTVEPVEELSAGEKEVVERLTPLKAVPREYPEDLLAARRSAFIRQLEGAGEPNVWDQIRASFQRIFPVRRTLPPLPHTGARRSALVMASLLLAALIGSVFLPRMERSLQFAAVGRQPVRASTAEVALTICRPEDQTPACLPREMHALQDLADPGNGTAQPAVSKDAHASADGVHSAAYVNDGRSGASWVSDSPESWIKIDLGQVRTINTVSMQKGSSSQEEDDPGQFAIAVALSDEYADGDSTRDEMEYAQVFDSSQAGFSGMVSDTETIQTQFAPVQARFVKLTFEKAGTAIEEVGVFLAPPPVLAAQPTRTAQVSSSGVTQTAIQTSTGLAANPATLAPTATWLPTTILVANATNTFPPAATNASTALPSSTLPPEASNTPIPLPTNTPPPTESSTPVPVPIRPSPSHTPAPPTTLPPTAVPPTVELPPPIPDTIVVTGNGQTLTFTCNGNAAVIRGRANTVTLLGSCSSITVTGNGNQVFWESGSPVITNRGNDNIISQL